VALATAAGLDAQGLSPRDVDMMAAKPADARIAYGAGPLQFGELRLPEGEGPFPVVMVVHGGCRMSRLATLRNTAAFADALRGAGVATWNVEYRRLGDEGGGWPGTLVDVGAALDHLRTIAAEHRLDLGRVVVAGHSAGAHLALWAAARSKLPAGNELRGDSPLPVLAVVALGGPGDLRDFATYGNRICGPALEQLLGGAPEAVPERWAQASPAELLPLGVEQVLIVGEKDPVMPAASRDAYVAAATRAGDSAKVVVVPGGHFEVIAPIVPAFQLVREQILALVEPASRAP
jgi:acetyl esterase/lipase